MAKMVIVPFVGTYTVYFKDGVDLSDDELSSIALDVSGDLTMKLNKGTILPAEVEDIQVEEWEAMSKLTEGNVNNFYCNEIEIDDY